MPTDIKIDNRGHVWIITTASRLYDFNPATGTYTTWLSDKLYTAKENSFMRNVIAVDSSDNIWMTTNAGLQYFDRRTGKFSVFNSGIKKQLEHTMANHLVVDSFGTLWIGSSTDGLLKYDNKAQFKSYIYDKDDKNSITSGWANFFYESSDGKIWIGTSGSSVTSGINILDTRTGFSRQFLFRVFPASWMVFFLFGKRRLANYILVALNDCLHYLRKLIG